MHVCVYLFIYLLILYVLFIYFVYVLFIYFVWLCARTMEYVCTYMLRPNSTTHAHILRPRRCVCFVFLRPI